MTDSTTPTPTRTSTLGAGSPSATPTISATLTPPSPPTAIPLAFTGIVDGGLGANPVVGGHLKLWLNLSGEAEQGEVRVYSQAFNRIATLPFGRLGSGRQTLNLELPGLPAQLVFVQVGVADQGRWRRGPVWKAMLWGR